MDFFMNKIADVLDRFGNKIPAINFQFEKYGQMLSVLTDYLADANMIFPVDTIMICLGILMSVRAALLIIWVVQFIRNLLPF